MRFSESWLREWVSPAADTDTLVAQLTMAGLEVDAVEPAAPVFTKVVIGEIVAIEPHPDADKLNVCQVSVGEAEPLQIVCGARNACLGLKAPTAVVGAKLPGDFKIKKAKLRGVQSFGMLCAEQELGLAEQSDGLMELPVDAPVGTCIREFLSLDDQCIEVDLTPNRGDCLSIAGIAREVGVLNRCDVSVPEVEARAASIEDTFPVELQADEACPVYLGRVIRGVNPKAETPLWMQERLRRSGVRSLGPAVDVTNYVLLELGQPMHAFDLAKLTGKVQPRMANVGESLTLLDGQTVELRDDTLVIADDTGPLALAGIMGGQDSAVSDATSDLFLECAFFAPLAVAGKARSYGLHTDSSHRYERGVDPALQKRAMERASGLILDIMGGSAGPVVEAVSDEKLPKTASIELREQRLTRLLGLELPVDEVTEILQRLGMQVEHSEAVWSVQAPSYRFDVTIEADLVEEVGRIYGYSRLPSTNTLGDVDIKPVAEAGFDLQRACDLLVDRDYQEAITYSFVEPELQAAIEPRFEAVQLANPISTDMAAMRTSLWPGLIQAVLHNRNRQQNRVRLFESGLRFRQEEAGLNQQLMLAGALMGPDLDEQWSGVDAKVDFFDAKGDVEAILGLASLSDISWKKSEHPALHPGQAADIYRDEQLIGVLGMLHPQLQQKLGLDVPLYLFEIDVPALQGGALPAFEAVSKFPAIRRDIAVIVDEAVEAEKVRECIVVGAGRLLSEIVIFDVYRGKGVEIGRKSLALGLILQDSCRTLTDEDVEEVMANVLTLLKKTLGAELRE